MLTKKSLRGQQKSATTKPINSGYYILFKIFFSLRLRIQTSLTKYFLGTQVTDVNTEIFISLFALLFLQLIPEVMLRCNGAGKETLFTLILICYKPCFHSVFLGAIGTGFLWKTGDWIYDTKEVCLAGVYTQGGTLQQNTTEHRKKLRQIDRYMPIY